ncbi:MAG: M48 family metalloprotease, partial [Solirubrobacterales bacterium]|nr:M48 family metalloprotease [Solirubrobacterales bacterium]
MTTHLGLSGHSIGDVALLAPMLGLAASLMSVSVGLWRATRAIRVWVRSTSIGAGPQRSVIVGEHDVVVAAAGFRRPTVIVSAGALTTFDDEELAASLAHERGHIAHRHRFVLASAEVCRSLARLLPGTRRAVGELAFHLERCRSLGDRTSPRADRARQRDLPARERRLDILAVAMTTLVLALSAALPSAVLAGG